MDWRREVEALVAGACGECPPVLVELGSAEEVWCQLRPRDAPFLTVVRRLGGRVTRCRSDALPLASGSLASAALTWVGAAAAPAERRPLLAELARALAPGATLVVVDHNRPRRRLAAIGALVARPRVPGATATARWRRLGYPTARETQAMGFRVERLLLASGERLQVVLARRR